MKKLLYLLIMLTLTILASDAALAKEAQCFFPENSSWTINNTITCEQGVFTTEDLELLTINFDRTDCAAANAYCSGSDVNKDGVVDGMDLKLLTLNFCGENCAPVCGDGACNGDESCSSCPADCGACPEPEPSTRPTRRSSGGSRTISTIPSIPEEAPITIVESAEEDSPAAIDIIFTDSSATENAGAAVAGGAQSNANDRDEEERGRGNALTGMAVTDIEVSGRPSIGLLLLLLVALSIVIVAIVRLRRGRTPRK